jgi:hypothetical protein
MNEGLAKAYKISRLKMFGFCAKGSFRFWEIERAAGNQKIKITFGVYGAKQSADDLGFSITTYEMKSGDKTTEKEISCRFGKLIGGRWQIVLDVFAPIPSEQK